MSASQPKRASADSRVEVALPDGGRADVRLVVNRRARRVSLRLDVASRTIVAVAPSARALAQARAFAQQRASWIAAALARLPPAARFAPGETIPLRGAPHLLERGSARETAHVVAGAPPILRAGGLDEAAFAARVRRFLVAEAKRDLAARVGAHAERIGARFSRITVKDSRSRWGSCSASGALAFSWRVILAPPPVLDYLAAHEVAHLREMNHGPRFWALVAELAPQHRAARDWLKRHGPALHAVGAG